jgi:cell wall-associated NlpC family hydrolase
LRSYTRVLRQGLPAAAALSISLALAAPASAQTGGVSTPGETDPPPSSTPAPTVPGARAKLTSTGKAIAPAGAPQAVIDAIAAGNRIRKKPYIYGGGHKSFNAKGYDCSGAVSYVLHAAGMLKSPLPSGALMSWAKKGKGSWITVFANRSHAYAVIAGLRWDTSAVNEPTNSGSGPRWRRTKRSSNGYNKRHWRKF